MQNPKKLTMRIQRRNNLNDVYVDDVAGPGNGRHNYKIVPHGFEHDKRVHGEVQFQFGPRNADGSVCGILESDLLEIVRHRLQCFQAGEYATRENAVALTKIEEALMWLAKRADDRAERGVLGTTEK